MTARPVRVLAWPAYANRDNPYHALLHDHLRAHDVVVDEYSPAALQRGDWDVFHVHWPEFLLGSGRVPRRALSVAAFAARVARARARGRVVVWTVHNLTPHDRGMSGRAVYRTMSRLVDGVVGLTEASLDAARARYPALRRRPGFVVPHGHFRAVYPPAVGKGEARRSLSLDAGDRVLLFFGAIRPYKQVDRLLAAFSRTGGDDLRLVVAGHAPDDMRPMLAAAAADPRVVLDLGFVPDDELPRLFAAADVVVVPYHQDAMNSSVALLALSFDRPVLAPATGSFPELQQTVGATWVRTFEALEPDALVRAVDAARALPPDARPPLDDLDWDVLAGRMAAVYRELTSA